MTPQWPQGNQRSSVPEAAAAPKRTDLGREDTAKMQQAMQGARCPVAGAWLQRGRREKNKKKKMKKEELG
jgi:hypothetical protein